MHSSDNRGGNLIYLLGTAVGVVMTILGILIIIPRFGPGGIIWTAVAVLVTRTNAYGLVKAWRRNGQGGTRG